MNFHERLIEYETEADAARAVTLAAMSAEEVLIAEVRRKIADGTMVRESAERYVDLLAESVKAVIRSEADAARIVTHEQAAAARATAAPFEANDRERHP